MGELYMNSTDRILFTLPFAILTIIFIIFLLTHDSEYIKTIEASMITAAIVFSLDMFFGRAFTRCS